MPDCVRPRLCSSCPRHVRLSSGRWKAYDATPVWGSMMASLRISDTISDGLSTDARKRLCSLEAWDLSAVSRRTQARMRWPYSRRKAVEREYRRFLALIVLDPTQSYGMAGDVDELWHDHILDTQDYIGLCQRVVGALVHHIPANPKKRNNTAASYETVTLPALRKTYRGRLSPVWPRRGQPHAVARCCNHISEMPTSW